MRITPDHHATRSGRAPVWDATRTILAHVNLNAGARERARVVARLIAAAQALPANRDVAALLLDGALSQMLAQWAQQARVGPLDLHQALAALDDGAPAIAGRVRLALQAQRPEARLAHCWALLDLLTTWPTAAHPGATRSSHRMSDQITTRYADPSAARKDGESHVS
jgi:hypothetical protein